MSWPTLLDLIAEREATAGATAQRLREQIAALTEQLTATETDLADLATTRKTLTSLTGDTTTPAPVDATIASAPYQQILAVFDSADTALRAKDVCQALGAGITAKDTEGLRTKLKRLVNRQILTETEPGLFTLAERPSASPVSSNPHPDPNPKRT